MRKLFAALSLLVATPAWASGLSGPLIKHVINDKAYYPNGGSNLANIEVDLTNSTGSTFTGQVMVGVCSRGALIGFKSAAVTNLANGVSSSVTLNTDVPSLNAKGYPLVIAAFPSNATNPGVACSGTGVASGSSAATDIASGAILKIANPWVMPIPGFINPATIMSTTYTPDQIARNMLQYHINWIEAYDPLWRHDEPYPSSDTWKQLYGITMTKSAVLSMATALHNYSMVFEAYSLWDGAWSDYRTANPNVTASMGRYTSACGANGGSCSLSQQGTNGVGAGWPSWGWQSDGLYLMNPSNGRWQSWMASQFRSVLTMGFDGIHLDTLGADGVTYYDGAGRKLPELGAYLAPFANMVQTGVNRCTDLNQVSGWNIQDMAVRSIVCNFYVEPHPEYGNFPYFPDMNGLIESYREWSARPLITAYYPQQVYSGELGPSFAVTNEPLNVCDPSVHGSATCVANSKGIELLMGQAAVSGVSQLLLGDYDALVPGPFFPRTPLGMSADLQQWLADYYNWFAGQADILYSHNVDSTEVVNILDSSGNDIGSSSGVAGKVYYRAFTAAGVAAGATFTNLVGVANNRADDPNGQHSPTSLSSMQVAITTYGNSTPGTLWFSAPDVNHGFPQALSYTLANGKITFTMPQLNTVALVWLESGTLSSTTHDFTISATDFLRGASFTFSSNGMGAYGGAMVHGCCHRYAYWQHIDFGTSGSITDTHLITTSAKGSGLEVRLDAPNGPLIATVYAPAGSLIATQMPLLTPVSGVHNVYIVFTDRDVEIDGFQP